jgi:hypothetical protein
VGVGQPVRLYVKGAAELLLDSCRLQVSHLSWAMTHGLCAGLSSCAVYYAGFCMRLYSCSLKQHQCRKGSTVACTPPASAPSVLYRLPCILWSSFLSCAARFRSLYAGFLIDRMCSHSLKLHF